MTGELQMKVCRNESEIVKPEADHYYLRLSKKNEDQWFPALWTGKKHCIFRITKLHLPHILQAG
jgi:hypothetical protein